MPAVAQRAPHCSWERCIFTGKQQLLHVKPQPARSSLWPRTLLTFSTSVGLAIAEEITPETTPQITLISNVSSAIKKRKSDPKDQKRRCRDCTEQARSSGKSREAHFANHMMKLHEHRGWPATISSWQTCPHTCQRQKAAAETLSKHALREKRVMLMSLADQTRKRL